MYTLFRLLLVNTVWRLISSRNERIADERMRARVAASFPPPPPMTVLCPECGSRSRQGARYCAGCLREL